MSVSEAIGARLNQLRRVHGWSAAQLAEAMTKVGVPWDRQVVSKLENGRRKVLTVDELLALAYVLDIAPVHLLVPTDAGASERYAVTPTVTVSPSAARAWIRGRSAIGQVDRRWFGSQVPHDEYDLGAHHEAAIERGGDGSWTALRDDQGRQMFDDRGYRIAYDDRSEVGDGR